MANKEWTTVYPGNLDTTTQMPSLVDNEDVALASQWDALRNSAFRLQSLMGSNHIEPGSVRARLGFLEDGYAWLEDGYEHLSSWLNQIGGVIHVDGNRTDDYVANGTAMKPFKTIQAGINQAIASDAALVSIVPLPSGSAYAEQFTMPGGICLFSPYYSTTVQWDSGVCCTVILDNGEASVITGIQINSQNHTAIEAIGAAGGLALSSAGGWSHAGEGILVTGGCFLELDNASAAFSDLSNGLHIAAGSGANVTSGSACSGGTHDVLVDPGCGLDMDGSAQFVTDRVSNAGSAGYWTSEAVLRGHVSNTIHVDGGRTDSYIPDGTIYRPYKTIQAGIDAASAGKLVWIATGQYNEQLTLKDNVSLYTPDGTNFWLQYDAGDVITFAGTSTIQLTNIGCGTAGAYHAFNMNGTGRVITWGCGFYNNSSSAEAILVQKGQFDLYTGGWVGNDNGHGCRVKSGGNLQFIFALDVWGYGPSHYSVVVESGGVFGTDAASQIENGISNAGTQQLFSLSSYLGNDSDIVGASAKDALNNAAAIPNILQSRLAHVGPFLLANDTAYFVFLGYIPKAITPKYVEFYVSTIGAGAQTAEVGFFSSPTFPNKASQSLTKLVATGTVDSLTATGVKRNTAAFSTLIPAGTYLWVGIRTAMGTTQPTILGLGWDFGEGQILQTASAGVLTGSGPWTGAIIAEAGAADCPSLRGSLV